MAVILPLAFDGCRGCNDNLLFVEWRITARDGGEFGTIVYDDFAVTYVRKVFIYWGFIPLTGLYADADYCRTQLYVHCLNCFAFAADDHESTL
jgi:hypothetical protein